MTLEEDIYSFYDDPYGFVLYAFPWGEHGPLEQYQGPDEWQSDFLKKIGEHVRKREWGEIRTALRAAVTSGHGVGKSAMTSWIILWFISTRVNPQILVTANTKNQLTSKTWRELAKWHKLLINKDWFEWTATKFYKKNDPETWFAAAIPWSENRPDAFAGTHEEHVLVIFDEASGIPNNIYETVEGAMTTPGAMWFLFGNPIRNTGRFAEAFGKYGHRWIQYKVDSRNAAMANSEEIEQWKKDYGEDSDYFKVRVRGEFPGASTDQFISVQTVENCIGYNADNFAHMPFVVGVDVARFGDDSSVIAIRQGRKLHELHKFKGLSTVDLTHRIASILSSYQKYTLFMDGAGVGGGVIDYARSLGLKVIECNGGHAADDPTRYFNKRAEMWGRMKEWLMAGADIPNDPDLREDLISINYEFSPTSQIILEKKSDMKRRGINSPDCADALSFTFYTNVTANNQGMQVIKTRTNWDVFSR